MHAQKNAKRSSTLVARGFAGLGLSLSMAVAGAADGMSSQKALEQRVRALEDRADIEKLITSDYAKTLDLNDPEARAVLFTEDGEMTSEMIDMAAVPEPLRVLFNQDGASSNVDKLRPRVTFKGRAAIANSMEIIFKDRPKVSVEGGAVVATFTYTAPTATGQSTGPAPDNKRSALPSLMRDRYVSAKHLITNPSVQLDGDNATAISYWIEVVVGKDGKQSIADGGYYSDVLKRVNGVWRFKQRVIYSYDIALGPPSGSPAATGAPSSR